MKQHITKEQAREIYKQMCEYLPTIGLAPKGYYDLSEWLTIGRMIEIIGWKLAKIDYDGFTNNYYVQVRNIATFARPELCDALWEAVKAIL